MGAQGCAVMGDVWGWLTSSANWQGDAGIPHRLVEHLQISATAVLLAMAVALPVAIVLGHLGRGGFLAVNVGNVGRAIPTFGLLIIFASWSPIGVGNRAAILALALFAIPPLLTNTYIGMRGVDEDVKDAARGMGMTGRQVVRKVEVPLAVPLIFAGIRTATVQVVATATLAALVAGGGLGRYIVDGRGTQDNAQLYSGVVLVVLLCLALEGLLAVIQRRLDPVQAPEPGAATPVDVSVTGS
jgi:osmoprotectant transport system permease protein